jgi:hypothetical protein
MLTLPKKIDLIFTLANLLATRSFDNLPTIALELCEELNIDPTFVLGLCALAKKDFGMLINFAKRFGSCDSDKIDKLTSLVSHLSSVSVSKANSSASSLIKKATKGAKDGLSFYFCSFSSYI